MRAASTRRQDSPLPWIAAAGGVLVVIGWLCGDASEPQLTMAAPWLITAAVLSVITAATVAWSPTGGGVIAAGLWLVAGGWFLRWLPDGTAHRGYWPLLLVAGLVLTAVGLPAMRHGRSGSRGMVNRWAARSRRNDGVASSWQMWRAASRHAMRRKAKVLRPELCENATWWQRVRMPTTEFATPLVRVGLQRVWSAVEDVVLVFGGPRKGKTGLLAGRILDAPGAVIATSTRTDLIRLARRIRERTGPAYLFNPAGIGGHTYTSTITFDPLSGCEQPKTANDRAADLLSGISAPGVSGGDREFWASQARRVLAALLHAAALGGYSMREVLVWVSDPDGATAEVQRLLRRSSEPNYEADALQFLTTNDRTRSSITATVMPELSWMTDPTTETSATGGSFDVEALLAEQSTVYMLGAEDAQTAPLVTALTGHIAREARRIAGLQESGRLDPPFTLVLDEAAIICPVPLDKWTADMGGRNITIHIAAQSRAQLRQRYGEDGAAAIMNNASTMLVFGGTKDDKDLQAYATLTGERDEQVATYDDHRRVTSTTVRRVPVLSGAQIAQLPATRVVVYRPDMPVAVGRAPMAWNRRDVRLDNLHTRAERAADTWRRFRAWGGLRAAAAVEWTVTRMAHTGERVRQLRAERALRRTRPPLDPARIEAIEREPATAQVIALPTRREAEDDS